MSIANTNGYNTRAQSKGYVSRIYLDIVQLINKYVRFKELNSIKQCNAIRGLYIVVNANIGTFLQDGKLSQNVYIASINNRRHLLQMYGENHPQTRYALKQLNIYSNIYEEMCLSENNQIPIEIFHKIFSYI
jgi:hypothetical protein